MPDQYPHCKKCPCYNCRPDNSEGACGGDIWVHCMGCDWDAPNKLPIINCYEEEDIRNVNNTKIALF